MKVSLLPPAHIDRHWPRVAEILTPALKTANGRIAIADLREELLRFDVHLWIVFEDADHEAIDIVAACTTRVTEYPRRRMMVGGFIAGERMDEWLSDLLAKLDEWVVDNGCDGFEFTGRRGWGKALKSFGWEASYVVFEKDYRGSGSNQLGGNKDFSRMETAHG